MKILLRVLCEEGGDCIVVVYFHGKLDFKPVQMKAQ
jgi:hypothetical protein